jgi:large subunit ribosomal protein L4e
MTSRPVVSVYKSDNAKEIADSITMPAVFTAPIRNDLVQFVHTNLAKNRRQGHAVFHKAGQEHSAESWGTGRAVARIPRISGSGTSRSGQATFGNMCRKARMFAPLKIWRKWHRTCNIAQRRHAVASALAASACVPLVMARGHRVEGVPELPLVIDNLNQPTTKTLLSALQNFGVGEDLAKVRLSKKIRSGTGKYRNSRYVMRKGPLVIYGDESVAVKQAARNLPGVETCHVTRLNILQLAPGGHLGRFLIFTKDAFKALNNVFGTYTTDSQQKTGYKLARSVMNCADIARIINSDQVQAKLREVRQNIRVHDKTKKNPLNNKAIMNKLNPFAKKRAEILAAQEKQRQTKRAAALKAKKTKEQKAAKLARNQKWTGLQDGLEAAFKTAQDILDEEERQGNYVPGETSSEESDE